MRSDTRRKKSLALVFFVAVLEVIDAKSCPENCKSDCNAADGGCSECNEGWFGRHCSYRLECYIGRGLQYYGTMSKTENNITCETWSNRPPGAYSWTSVEEQKNYCRNPNPKAADDKPWCYQAFGGRFQYCNVPHCDTQCPAPDLIVFGDVINPPTSGFVKGFVVEVVTSGCGPGSRGKMTCQQNLTWSKGFECAAIPGWCKNPPTVSEPSYTEENRKEFYYLDFITVRCRAGYEIVGSKQIICQADKSWSAIPQCTRVKCDKPSLSQNSKISKNIKSSYKYEDEIIITCLPGYDIIGQSAFKCLANKQWNGTLPTCKVVECSQPILNENSYVQNKMNTYIYRDQITIKCYSGYTRKGAASFTCGADKLWSGTFPTCERVPCKPPELLPNTELQSPQKNYVYKDEVRLKCKKGYELDDRETITCLANQTWGTIPGCSKICDGLSTAQLVGITLGFSLMSGIVSAFITIFVTRRYLHTDKTKETVPKNSVTKTNEAFEYDVIDVNMRDEPNVYSVIPK